MPKGNIKSFFLYLSAFTLLLKGITGSMLFGQQYLYKYLTVNDELPSDYVTAMHFDKAGNFWIGTDKGLCIYNNASAQTLTIDEGLGNNMVLAILEDYNGSIWVSGYESGLAKIKMVANKAVIEKSIRKPYTIHSILQDSSGYFWIKSKLTGDSYYQVWRTNNLEKNWELVLNISHLRAADITKNGFLYYIGSSTKWMASYANKIQMPESAAEDSSGVFASENKIAFFSSIRTVIFDKAHATPLFYKDGKPFIAGNFGRYLSDGPNDILYRTNKGNHIFVNGKLVTTIDNDANPLDNPFFFTATKFANHQLYLSHFGKGIMQWRTPYVVNYNMPEKVGRIVQTPSGIAVNAGSQIFTCNKKEYAIQKISTKNFPISFLTKDRNGKLLICIGNEFVRLNGDKWIEGPADFNDQSDLLFTNGNYYASSYSTGIHKITGENFDTAWKSRLQLPSAGIERLHLYDDSLLYAYTLSKGLFEINLSNLNTRVIDKSSGQLISNSVFAIFKEKDTLFVGTNKGLARIIHGHVIKWNQKNGFTGNRVYSIFRDRSKRLWVLSDRYLHLLKNDTLYAIRSFPVITDKSTYINTALYEPQDNWLWIGTNKNLLQVKMDAIEPDGKSYPLQIASIRVDGKLTVDGTSKLELESNTENISIQFVTPLTLQSGLLTFVRLKGYNNEWQPLNKEQLIHFQKLPAGKYQLQTKTEGPDFGGTFNDHLLSIQISPAWYVRPWAIITFLLLLSAITFFVSRYFSARKYEAQMKRIQEEQALEMERMRISRELHDNVGSMLTVVINRLSDTPVLSGKEQEGITVIARNTLSQLRDAIWTLDKSHLTMAQWINRSKQYLQQLSLNGTQIKVDFHFPEEDNLTPIKALHSFRIVQEACTNALKHSNAKLVHVSGKINTDHQYEIIIADNGIGFSPFLVDKGYGLRNMEKRAAELGGKLIITSKQGEGTTLRLLWPTQ